MTILSCAHRLTGNENGLPHCALPQVKNYLIETKIEKPMDLRETESSREIRVKVRVLVLVVYAFVMKRAVNGT